MVKLGVEKVKRPTIWNGGRNTFFDLHCEVNCIVPRSTSEFGAHMHLVVTMPELFIGDAEKV